MTIHDIMHRAPVIPVVTLDDADLAIPLSQALLEGGIRIIEVTLRTDAALESIRRIVRNVPEMCVGVGTIWNQRDLDAARDTGAAFGVSPGATPALLDAVAAARWPFLPGAQTPSEVADRVARGFEAVKFFPAETAGGVSALKALTSVFTTTLFCPTGGISAATAPAYRALRNVPVVGGSWLAPSDMLARKDWAGISSLAKAASDA